MYSDPALPKTPPPPHAAPHTALFRKTACQHHCSSRVGTVERPVEDSRTELQFNSHPRNVPVSEFLESLAPPEGARQCRPVRPTDSTKRYFQTLSTFPTDRSNPRWPNKPGAYSLFARSEDPFLRGPFHKTPSRVGTVTKSCDERTLRRLPPPEERTCGTRPEEHTFTHEREKYDHPVETDLRSMTYPRLTGCQVRYASESTFTTPKPTQVREEYVHPVETDLRSRTYPRQTGCHGRYASESTFTTPKPCSWSSSEDESKVCYDGRIRCRRGDEFPVCCRPVGSKSYPFTGPGSESQSAAPATFYSTEDSRVRNRFGFQYSDIESDFDQFFFEKDHSISEERDKLRRQRPYSLETEKPVLFTSQRYHPRGGAQRLSGIVSDEERYPKARDTSAETPYPGKSFYQHDQPYGKYGSRIGTSKRSLGGPRSNVWESMMVPQRATAPSVSKSERLKDNKQQLDATATPRNTLDATYQSPRATKDYGGRHQSQVGFPNRHFSQSPKTRGLSLSSYREPAPKSNKNVSKVEFPSEIDRNSRDDKKTIIPRIQLPKESVAQRDQGEPRGRGEPRERSKEFKDQAHRHASRIGDKYKGKGSHVSTYDRNQPRKTAAQRSIYAGPRKVTARLLGSSNPQGQSGEAAKKSRVPYVERPTVAKRPTKLSKNPSVNVEEYNEPMNAERQSME